MKNATSTAVFVTGASSSESVAIIHVRPLEASPEWAEPLLGRCVELGVNARIEEDGSRAVLSIVGDPEITSASLLVQKQEKLFAKEFSMGASSQESHLAMKDLQRALLSLKRLLERRLPGVPFADT